MLLRTEVSSGVTGILSVVENQGEQSFNFNFSHGGGAFILGLSMTGDLLGGAVIQRNRILVDSKAFRHSVHVMSSGGTELNVAGVSMAAYDYGTRMVPL